MTLRVCVDELIRTCMCVTTSDRILYCLQVSVWLPESPTATLHLFALDMAVHSRLWYLLYCTVTFGVFGTVPCFMFIKGGVIVMTTSKPFVMDFRLSGTPELLTKALRMSSKHVHKSHPVNR